MDWLVLTLLSIGNPVKTLRVHETPLPYHHSMGGYRGMMEWQHNHKVFHAIPETLFPKLYFLSTACGQVDNPVDDLWI